SRSPGAHRRPATLCVGSDTTATGTNPSAVAPTRTVMTEPASDASGVNVVDVAPAIGCPSAIHWNARTAPGVEDEAWARSTTPTLALPRIFGPDTATRSVSPNSSHV